MTRDDEFTGKGTARRVLSQVRMLAIPLLAQGTPAAETTDRPSSGGLVPDQLPYAWRSNQGIIRRNNEF